MSDRPQTLERWIAKVGLATFSYYLVTFAFETGYFWDVGVQYMSAFGLAEHTVHAAAYIVGTAGALAFLYTAMLHVPALLLPRSAPAPTIDEPPSTPPISSRRKMVSVLGVTPMILLICYSLVNFLRTAFTDGPSPVTVWPVLATTAFLLHLMGSLSWIDRQVWMVPAFLTAVLSPFALGQFVFAREVEGASAGRIKVGDREVRGTALFIGTDRLLLRVGDRVYITDRERKSVVAIPLR